MITFSLKVDIMSQEKKLEALFNVEKPVIGMLHLQALPGAPNNNETINEILELAEKDFQALIDGGVNGILIENYNDYPFYPNKVEPLTIASMAILVNQLSKKTKKPVGVNILRNDCIGALSVASITGASFIRCNFLVGAYVTDQGIINGCAHELMRLRNSLTTLITTDMKINVFADIHCKHASPLSSRSLTEECKDAFSRGMADAVIITGPRTGTAPILKKLKELNKQNLEPLIIGSGVSNENIEKLLPLADGAIIGTAFKKNGDIKNLVDSRRVKSIMKKAQKIQK
jgi:hypothetical protein